MDFLYYVTLLAKHGLNSDSIRTISVSSRLI